MVSSVSGSVRGAGILCLGLVACTPTTPPKQEPDGYEIKKAKVALPQTLRPAPSWRWDVLQEGADLTPGGSWSVRPFGTWFPISEQVETVDYARIDQGEDGARVAGYKSEQLPSEKRVWEFEFPGEVAVGTMLRTDNPFRQTVIVAHHSPIASGTTLMGINAANGHKLWEVPLQGLGPVAHSKYRNEVQLESRERNEVIVYGKESQGRFVELLDGRSGRQLAHGRVTPLGPETIPDGDERTDYQVGDACEVTESLDSDDWNFKITFCPYSSGVTLEAARHGQDPAWTRHLRGVGSVAHSEYFANYRIEVHDGNPMVIGWESAGDFLEIRDAETGAELWSIVKRN